MKKLFTLVAAAVMAVSASAEVKTLYSWESPEGTPIETGGTIAYVNGDGNRLNYTNSGLYTICLNGKKANLSDATPSANAGHMVITFDEALKAGDKVTMTAFYNKNSAVNVSAWLVFENGTTVGSARVNVAANMDKTVEGATATPEDITVEVPEAADGSKTLTLTRNDGGTNMFITKLVVTGEREAAGPKPAIALTAEVDGNTRTFEVATLEAGTKITVDWGDGNIVDACEGVVYDGYSGAEFSGVVKGEGNVKIYGEGITLLDCVSKVTGPSVTALDVTNAPALQYLYANGNVKLETVDLTKSTELLKISLANNPTKSLDLTNCTKLTRIELQGVAATPSALESIDLSKNTELTYIQLNYNNLKSLDLSANAKATSIYALNNQIESVALPEGSACTYISLNNNKLTSFDGANLTAMTKSKGSIFLMNNNISELKNIVTKSLNLTGNKLTISTMPDLTNIGGFTNNSQQAMTVAETVTSSLDLSSEADNGTTTYAVYNEDGTAVDAANYTVEGGVITFAEALNGKNLYVTMTNATYKFTGANVLKTTTFAVSVPTSINAISNVAPKAVMYNLAGQRVANAKGIVIMNGKKVIK